MSYSSKVAWKSWQRSRPCNSAYGQRVCISWRCVVNRHLPVSDMGPFSRRSVRQFVIVSLQQGQLGFQGPVGTDRHQAAHGHVHPMQMWGGDRPWKHRLRDLNFQGSSMQVSMSPPVGRETWRSERLVAVKLSLLWLGRPLPFPSIPSHAAVKRYQNGVSVARSGSTYSRWQGTGS